MDAKELQPGNIVNYDYREGRNPPEPNMPGIIKEITATHIIFQNEAMRRHDQCAGIVITLQYLKFCNLKPNPEFITRCNAKGIYFVHQLQNKLKEYPQIR